MFTVKYQEDENIDRCTPRLVAKGFALTYGIDYQENFALVATVNLIQAQLSHATNLRWAMHQPGIFFFPKCRGRGVCIHGPTHQILKACLELEKHAT